MPYHVLIKTFAHTRDYMRQFFIYGFRSREEYHKKSARSYDNERRRIASWLGDAMSFRQDSSGKTVFLTMDSRKIARNPLYQAYKAKSFTKNDISLHFILLDILRDKTPRNITQILNCIDGEYLPAFEKAEPMDESTLRKKLREYVDLGLIAAEKSGRQLIYQWPEEQIQLESWQDAVLFYSETDPLGVIGSYLLDKFRLSREPFMFKHHYLLFALDSGIMLELLLAMREQRKVQLEVMDKTGRSRRITTIPLKIYISVQGARQYLAAANARSQRLSFIRLDYIQKVKPLEISADYDCFQQQLKEKSRYLWGVSGSSGTLQHLDMTLQIVPRDGYIVQRLLREKRNGSVRQTGDTRWTYSVDTYNPGELLPWLRTFTGRIVSLTCTDRYVEQQFWSDLRAMRELYGGGGNAV